ncbi:MAG TPA: signal peptidase II [Candidatus Methylomirabilis sp.]|nr:signal peptidase II [Candidatus Methylomirabilis sp.]
MQKGSHAGGINFAALGNAAQVAVVVFILDRATKAFFQSVPPSWTHATNSVVTLVRHENYGIIANVPLPIAVTVTVTAFVILLVLGAAWTAIQEGKPGQARALGILLGGATGNLYDRVVQGFVFDWILLFGRSAINFADIAIVLGAVSYFILKRRDDQMDIARGTGQQMHT